jgi:hypothetical protein
MKCNIYSSLKSLSKVARRDGPLPFWAIEDDGNAGRGLTPRALAAACAGTGAHANQGLDSREAESMGNFFHSAEKIFHSYE